MILAIIGILVVAPWNMGSSSKYRYRKPFLPLDFLWTLGPQISCTQTIFKIKTWNNLYLVRRNDNFHSWVMCLPSKNDHETEMSFYKVTQIHTNTTFLSFDVKILKLKSAPPHRAPYQPPTLFFLICDGRVPLSLELLWIVWCQCIHIYIYWYWYDILILYIMILYIYI